jgi:insertion element IS1 protein InsB
VKRKSDREWPWVALCRRTRQVVAFFSGDRSEGGCRALWELVPGEYKQSCVCTDFWEAYGKVLGEQGVPHQAVGKDSGQTNHVERWNNTLGQRIGRFVRKTLSFSKSYEMHWVYLKLFIYYYNLSLII